MTVSIRASLLLSALGLAALTAAFVAPDTHGDAPNLQRDALQSQGASATIVTPNIVNPIRTQLNVDSNVGNCVQLTDIVETMIATPDAVPARGCVSNSQNTTKSTAQTPNQNHTAHSGAVPLYYGLPFTHSQPVGLDELARYFP